MPELPEVETIRKGLSSVLVGQKIEDVEVLLPKTVWVDEVRATGDIEVGHFASLLKGQTVEAIDRRAKLLIFSLSGGVTLLVHLKMTGQLIYVSTADGVRLAGGHPTSDMSAELPTKSTRAVFRLSGGVLYFNDQRQFGYIKVIPSQALAASRPYAEYGPEPLSEEFTVEYLEGMVARRPRIAIKQLLLDQTIIAGIGNIYADESLFGAYIYPGRLTSSLSRDEIGLLWREIIDVLALGVKHNGTSSEHYVQANGLQGTMQHHLRVYRRAGLACVRCGAEIERTVIGGRGTHYCPRCQPKG